MEIFACNYIETRQLYDYAAAAARLLKPAGESRGKSLIPPLRKAFGEISRSHAHVSARCSDMSTPPPACLWLMDNFYMVQREYSVCRGAFLQAKRLRCCREGLLITELCRSLLSSGQGEVSEERCRVFLDGFQSVTVLRRSELELFPAVLRLVCLEALAGLCSRLHGSADTAEAEQGFAAVFTTLRLLSVLDCEKLINSADIPGAILAADPTGEYGKMDEGSKKEYLRRLQRLAKSRGVEEHVLASSIVREAKRDKRHVGHYLFKETTGRAAAAYIAFLFSATLIISLYIALAFDSAAAALLLLLPVSELVKSLTDFILLRILPPTRLCRMDVSKLHSSEGKTVMVISAILDSADSALRLAGKLEDFYCACKRERSFMSFALLADLREASQRSCPEDAAVISAAEREIERLNEKYGGGFCLFTRERSFDGEKYSGKERKRGALIELARFLRDDESSLHISGDRKGLENCRFILTVDSDTAIYPGAAGELIGAMLHPLSRPVIDESRGVVTKGHGIIQPRIDTQLKSASETDFALIFAGSGGSDPYGGLCGELYMDAFKSGGFAGKGIIDIDSLLFCTAKRFPEGCILSHDALEGAYLRGGFMGDAEFSDAFPSRPLAYYKRWHRWVRGDWQNSPWIFKKELPAIERFRLFDSLRRSMIAPATLLAILAGFYFPMSSVSVAAWAALAAMLSRLFISLAEESVRQREKVRLRRYTRLLTGIGGAIVQSFMRLWLLPWEAWVCLSAACTALWRMLVSHRRLLQWQTFAQTQVSEGLAAHIKAMLLPLFLGLLLMVSAPGIMGRAAGFMWLLSPAAAAALALPVKSAGELSRADRDYVISAAAESWRYLTEFCAEEDNFLPPDNFQEQPPVGLAHRTSPTNIGLAMVSAIAAMDMGIASADTALGLISRMLSTLERMPRSLGHFYNWYDTRSLRPLSPPYISTVDSGNLCACLICLCRAMDELGERDMASRLRALTEEMDFAPLFDTDRKLFYICYDTERSRGAGGWYDLMASEAMLTSFVAISKGDVPVKHWRRLSRAQLQKDGYRGLASWTGTMFEYLMPELFLPFYQGSLLFESGRFCVYAQKRNRFAGKPWGISESAFYSLDNALSYRYKAHGCSALALKRGQEADMVISPYSSFLAMSVDGEAAVKNLRRLERMGGRGRFGFIEALDFTPGRCRSDKGEKVRCYMAHHVGMSIISAANAVCSGSIQRRFMADPRCSAHSLLLQERLPSDGIVIRREMSSPQERPARSGRSMWQLRGSKDDTGLYCCLLSNGAYNIMSTNRGSGRASVGGLCIYRDSLGLDLLLSGKRHSLISQKGCEKWVLSEEYSAIEKNIGDINCRSELYAAAGEWGECRSLSLKSRKDTEAEVRLGFVPILADYNDYVNHTSFWRLGLEAYTEGRYLLIKRLERNSLKECWLCVGCSHEAEFSADSKGSAAAISHPLVSVRTRLYLKSGERTELRFAICLGRDREEALQGARRIIKGVDRACLVSAVAGHMGIFSGETAAAMAMLRPLCFKKLKDAAPKHDLWQYGISGDLPLICCQADAVEAMPLLKRFCLLKSCGFECELVYLSDEGGEYRQPFRRRVTESLAALGLEELIGSRGGIHFAPMSAADTVKSRAQLVIGGASLKYRRLEIPRLSESRRRGSLPQYRWTDQGFEYYVNHSLPPRAWQNMLGNSRLSCIAADTGIMAMWYKNARELPIYQPLSDPREFSGSEALWVRAEGRDISLFAANDAHSCTVFCAPGFTRWEKDLNGRTVSTTAFIPAGIDARVLIVRGAEGLEINWAMKPSLKPLDSSSVQSRVEDGIFRCENPESFLPVEFLAASSNTLSCRDDFTPAAMLMTVGGEELTVLVCGCCSEDELKELCKGASALSALDGCKKHWQDICRRFRLKSVDILDRYMNSWALYQSIACRLDGRSSLYQSGGAYGFRDQLQDAVNLILISREYAKDRILDACRHQYAEGDVMHWWHPHPEGDRGLRSRCSDDLLWLVWALCEYWEKTGDGALCEASVPYLSSPPLRDEERDRYECVGEGESISVLEHARRALDLAADRGFGPHGLPFFGSGDWNDALDNVDGESVWLGWFMSLCAHRFAKLLDSLGQSGKKYAELAESLGKAADSAWSGRHYYRGYLSDGSVLGGEDRLDSICQSWAALNPYASKAKVRRALKECLEKLPDGEHALVRISTPPYGPEDSRYGYISSYGRGFRENGGQYTHAAVWLAMALFETGMREEGYDIIQLLLPSAREVAVYEAEPYVLAADVYSAPGHEGEAGWTWYTGSAAWFFRVVCENMLGIKMEAGEISICPNMPPCLPGYSLELHPDGGKKLSVEVKGEEIRIKRKDKS